MLEWTRGEAWHVTNAAALKLIRGHGLLSASELVKLFQVEASRAQRLLEENRNCFEPLHHPHIGETELRRQEMRDSKLAPALLHAGITPKEWRRYINEHIFFWLDRSQSETFKSADKDKRQVILRFDLAKLLNQYDDITRLTRINTGYVFIHSHKRSFADFYRWNEFPRNLKPVELVIPARVLNVEELLINGWPEDP